MALNIDSYLNHFMADTYGEDVSDAIVEVGRVLNTDLIVDIAPEQAIIKYHPIGNMIRRGIARMFNAFANYEPEKKVLIKSKAEYDALDTKDPKTLYLIRKEDKCIGVPLNDDGTVDLKYNTKGFTIFPEFFWSEIRYYLDGDDDEYLHGFKNKEIYVGSDYGVNEVLEEQFENTSLTRITIDLPSYIINRKAFFECYNLKEVYLGSGVTGIASDAFQECTNLERIYIDKPEGSVIGAPWDAYNATVIWTG